MVFGEAAEDADKFIAFAAKQDPEAVIPPKSNPLERREVDRHLSRERRLAECFFAEIKASE